MSFYLDLMFAVDREYAKMKRALESALGPGHKDPVGTSEDAPGTVAPAQTRTSEESSRSSSVGAGSQRQRERPHSPPVVGSAKESASGGPARGENTGSLSQGGNEGASPSTLSSGTRPRRSASSAQAKANVKPIPRKS